jgi:hypothetical protein
LRPVRLLHYHLFSEKPSIVPAEGETSMQPPATGSYQTSFYDANFDPPYWWKATVTARCPKCRADMSLGNAEGRGFIVACHACGFHRIHAGKDSNQIGKEVLQRLAAL